MCMTLMHPSVSFCLQCAGPVSTNLLWEIRSVQSARHIVSHTMRGRCTAAVRKTTSVPMEILHPWPVPVSVLQYRSIAFSVFSVAIVSYHGGNGFKCYAHVCLCLILLCLQYRLILCMHAVQTPDSIQCICLVNSMSFIVGFVYCRRLRLHSPDIQFKGHHSRGFPNTLHHLPLST